MESEEKYTIGGTVFYAVGSALYTPKDVEHTADELESRQVYLYNGTIGRFDHPQESVFSKLSFTPLNSKHSQYTKENEFESATPLSRIRPDRIVECPGCGGWAGEDPDDPTCYDCGYGIDD